MTATASNSNNNNNNQAAPDCCPCRAQSYAVLACLLRVSDEAVQHDYTCTPNNPHPQGHPQLDRSAIRPTAEQHVDSMLHSLQLRNSPLPWLPAAGLSSFMLLHIQSSHGPERRLLETSLASLVCPAVSDPPFLQTRPATVTAPFLTVVSLSLPLVQAHPTKSATQLAACILHLDPALPCPQSGAIATKNISTQELCLCR
jgi:hypothetical protein